MPLEQGIDNNPKLKAANYNLKAASAAYSSTKSAYAPRLNFRADKTRTTNLDGSETRNRDTKLMLQLSYNLFRGGADQARMNQAQYSKVASKYNLESIQRNVQTIVTTAWNALIANRKQLVNLVSYETHARKVLSDYQIQFKLGRRTLLDVLNMKNELFNSRAHVVNEKFSVILSGYNLLSSMGTLKENFNF